MKYSIHAKYVPSFTWMLKMKTKMRLEVGTHTHDWTHIYHALIKVFRLPCIVKAFYHLTIVYLQFDTFLSRFCFSLYFFLGMNRGREREERCWYFPCQIRSYFDWFEEYPPEKEIILLLYALTQPVFITCVCSHEHEIKKDGKKWHFRCCNLLLVVTNDNFDGLHNQRS